MYQALYREYRPDNFEDLYGQDHITRILKNQVEISNIGHAYLFSGTRGTGKTSAAKIFSRAVNCLEPVAGNPCNKCSNCIEILEEQTMDVIEMDAASNNSVEDIRDLRDRVVYPPSKLKYKVYIIDEVHMLSKGAFNALLKTLEEPPSHLIFILATTEQERLPQTILSRCQRFDFKRISNLDIVKNMEKIVEEKNVKVEDEVLRLIARNSDGAMRDALSLLEQCISYDTSLISYEDAIEILGITNVDLLFDLVDYLNNKEVDQVIKSIDGIVRDGKDIQQFIKDLISHYRNLMIIKSSKNPEELLEMDNLDRYKNQASLIDLENILRILDILAEAEEKSKFNSQPRITLELACIKIVNLDKMVSLEKRIKRLEEGYSPGPDKIKTKARPVKKNPVPVKKQASIKSSYSKDDKLSLEIIEENWPVLIEQIGKKKVTTGGLIREGRIIDYQNDLVTIGFGKGYEIHQESLSTDLNKSVAEEVFSEYFGRKMKLNFVMGKKKPVNKMDTDEKSNDSLDKSIEKVVDIFGEDIIDIIDIK